MAAILKSYQISRFCIPLKRVIGDSQVRFEKIFVVALELRTQDGQQGLGFLNGFSFPPQSELERIFEAEDWSKLEGQSIHRLLNRLTRPRGGNSRSHLFDEAVNQALWDLYGKEIGLPLYRLLGGTNNRVRAIQQSCCCFGIGQVDGFGHISIAVTNHQLVGRRRGKA